MVFEMSAQRVDDSEEPALGVLIEGLDLGDRLAPMLDWTTSGLAHLIPGRTVFRPVEPDDGELPYLDRSIDVVLVDDAERMDEAARVAARAVVRVAPGEAGGTVVAETRRLRSERRPDRAAVPILVATDDGDEWLVRLTEALADRPGVAVRAAVDPLAAAAETDAPIVVLAERGILPLPGCIEAAERLLAQDDELGGVAVKVFDADGLLEAAGGAAFDDGSVEGIAAGAAAAAPWHEYVRPVAAAVGLVVMRGAAARQSATASGAGPFDLTSLSAHLWSSGWGLRYQPDAAAVRVLAPPAAGAGVWPQTPAGAPRRPVELGDEVLAPPAGARQGGRCPMTQRRALVSQKRFPEIDRDTGSQRVDMFIGWLLERGWEVTFLATEDDGEPRHAHRLRQLGIPTFVGCDEAEGIVAAGKFDLALLAFWEPASKLLPTLRAVSPDTRVVIDSIDVHFLRDARRVLVAEELLGDSFGTAIACELNAYRNADAVLTVSSNEARLLGEFLGPERIHEIPLAHSGRRSPAPFEDRNGIVFIGNFRHSPNGEAVEYLCRDVLPRLSPALLAENPVYVIGSRLDAAVAAHGGGLPNVKMVGWVPSVVPYLERARVCVVPLLHGAGVKGKVIESLLAGTPVVTTTIGAEGMDLRQGEHALIADTSQGLADGLAHLLTDRARWDRLADAGYELACGHTRTGTRRRAVRRGHRRRAGCAVAQHRRNPRPRRRDDRAQGGLPRNEGRDCGDAPGDHASGRERARDLPRRRRPARLRRTPCRTLPAGARRPMGRLPPGGQHGGDRAPRDLARGWSTVLRRAELPVLVAAPLRRTERAPGIRLPPDLLR